MNNKRSRNRTLRERQPRVVSENGRVLDFLNEPESASTDVPSTDTWSENDRIGLAKRVLHTSIPSHLPCREAQIDFLYGFFSSHILDKIGGGLCISGSPGTGKTAVIHHVLDKLLNQSKGITNHDFIPVFINCVNLGCPADIYDSIRSKLGINSAGDDLLQRLTDRFTSRGKMIVLILDEIDQLFGTIGNECLSHLFEMTQVTKSKLILAGVANSLDLINQLPFIRTSSSNVASKRKSCGVRVERATSTIQHFHFAPYEREEIALILKTRLGGLELEELFDPLAIKLVAAKVASSSGDIRKALNACKTALDQTEKEGRFNLNKTNETGSKTSSPAGTTAVGILHEGIGVGSVAKVLKPRKADVDLPIQQQLLLATLLRIHHKSAMSSGVVSPISLSSVYQEYRDVSERKGFEFIDMSDVRTIFAMLEDRSLVTFASSRPPKPYPRKGVRAVCNNSQTVEAVIFDPKRLELMLKDSDLLDSIVFS